MERAPLMRWLELPADDGQRDLLMSVHSIGEMRESDPLSRYIARLQEERQRNERTRLAYVAVTRAREKLLLSGVARPADDEPPRPDGRSLLGILWPALRPHFGNVADSAGPAATALRGGVWRRVPADFDAARGLAPMPHVSTLDMGAETLFRRRNSCGSDRRRVPRAP